MWLDHLFLDDPHCLVILQLEGKPLSTLRFWGFHEGTVMCSMQICLHSDQSPCSSCWNKAPPSWGSRPHPVSVVYRCEAVLQVLFLRRSSCLVTLELCWRAHWVLGQILSLFSTDCSVWLNVQLSQTLWEVQAGTDQWRPLCFGNLGCKPLMPFVLFTSLGFPTFLYLFFNFTFVCFLFIPTF